MIHVNKQRINNYRFTIRFCHTAEAMGFKTVGQVRSFLRNVKPSFRLGTMRANKMQKELKIYLRSNDL